MNLNNDDYDEFDPEVVEAARKMGLDEEGMRELQRQINEQQLAQDDSDENMDDMLDEDDDDRNDTEVN